MGLDERRWKGLVVEFSRGLSFGCLSCVAWCRASEVFVLDYFRGPCI